MFSSGSLNVSSPGRENASRASGNCSTISSLMMGSAPTCEVVKMKLDMKMGGKKMK